MRTTQPARTYAAAVLLVIAAAILRAVIGPLGILIPFVTFYPAVIIAGVYGGIRAGLLATALSALTAGILFMKPHGRPWLGDFGDFFALVVFVISCSLLSFTLDIMYRAFKRAREAEARLELALEREKSSAAIQESEERFRTLADNIAQLAWMADGKGWIFWYNKRWYEYTGTTPDEMEGWGWQEVHHPDHVDRVVSRFRQSWETGESWEDTFPLRGKDGRYRWFLSRALPIRDESGKIVRWFGTNTDITEQLQAEARLRESEKKYRQLVNTIPAAIYTCDADGTITYYNQRAVELWGRAPRMDAPKEYCGSLRIYTPDGSRLPHDECPMAVTVRERKSFKNEEIMIERPDGSHVVASVNTDPVFDESGNLAGAINILIDVTDRKRIESELLRSKKEWELTFDSVPDMIAIMDRDYRLLRINRAMAERLRRKPEQILGRHCYTIMHGSSLPPDFCPHTQLLRDGKEHIVEIHEERLGGNFLLSVTPLLDEKGKVLGTVHVARDITERKRMEEALEKRLIALTQPLDSIRGIEFEDLFNLDEIQKLQDKFARACGVASIITRVDGTPITKPSNFCRLCAEIIRKTEKGRENCHCSDAVIGRHNPAGPTIQPCLSGGLWDAGASIHVGGKHIANWLVGQVRNETQTEARMSKYARGIGVDEDELISAFREVPSMSLDQFDSIAQALFTLAGQLSSMAYQNVQQARFISDRKQMEKELREARDELELRVQERTAELEKANQVLRDQAALLDLAHDAIFIRAIEDDKISFWNSGAEETYGFTKEEAIGRVAHELLQAQYSLEQIRDRVLREGRWDGELEHITAKGEKIIVESRWALKKDGKPEGILEINRDVMERKKAEEALKSNMKRLELINEELQEFAFVASHDLQEPLRKIQTFGNMLRCGCGTSLDAKGKSYLDRILKSAGRMRQLLDDLLQYSRVATRLEPFKKIDLGKIAQEAADVFEQQIREIGAKIEIKHLPSIEVDESQMLHLFQNLIGNALKFRGDSPPVVQLYGNCNGSCDIFVKDNGIGFEQQYAERIFKPFQRLHGRSEYEGTGMGLAIVRKIVERHGGTIRVESKPGQGTTFIMRLPAEQGRTASE